MYNTDSTNETVISLKNFLRRMKRITNIFHNITRTTHTQRIHTTHTQHIRTQYVHTACYIACIRLYLCIYLLSYVPNKKISVFDHERLCKRSYKNG